ncbi:unnamed protein product [Linum trigynum]|uniref:Uncharacterized protein n=1 Tax=Linum trigynum TaxID=586398 RepID=A0AAV2GAZ9_9ROSI
MLPCDLGFVDRTIFFNKIERWLKESQRSAERLVYASLFERFAESQMPKKEGGSGTSWLCLRRKGDWGSNASGHGM